MPTQLGEQPMQHGQCICARPIKFLEDRVLHDRRWRGNPQRIQSADRHLTVVFHGMPPEPVPVGRRAQDGCQELRLDPVAHANRGGAPSPIVGFLDPLEFADGDDFWLLKKGSIKVDHQISGIEKLTLRPVIFQVSSVRNRRQAFDCERRVGLGNLVDRGVQQRGGEMLLSVEVVAARDRIPPGVPDQDSSR